MAEIRSTLDIIMEKTKGLSLTEKEKKAFREKDIEAKVKGLVLKFQEGFFDLDRLKHEINLFKEQDRDKLHQALIRECLDQIDPEEDNQAPLAVLNHVLGLDTAWIQNLIGEFHQNLENERAIRSQALMKQIHSKGIFGSAVLPNLETDPEWKQFKKQARQDFQNKCREHRGVS